MTAIEKKSDIKHIPCKLVWYYLINRQHQKAENKKVDNKPGDKSV
jgi:hypothetical protein